ncbi:MAG: ABC transporter ATP-binding protein [Planctomycetota bacterium]
MNAPSDETAALRVESLAVRYGRHEALRSVDLLFDGPSLGLLGPNGAGKSTLIKTLLGLIRPRSGRALVFGRDAYRDRLEIRRRVGYVPERDCHVPDMSAVDYVTLGGELAGMPRTEAIQRAHEMLWFCGLGEARYRAVDGYSAGMKQRTKLAQALVHDPELLLLDEPTNGLDPEGRLHLLGILRDLQDRKGIRVVLSSHLLRDVEFVCREVAVVAKGRVVRSGRIEDLKRISDRNWRVKVRGELPAFVTRLETAGARLEASDASFRVETPDADGSRAHRRGRGRRGRPAPRPRAQVASAGLLDSLEPGAETCRYRSRLPTLGGDFRPSRLRWLPMVRYHLKIQLRQKLL